MVTLRPYILRHYIHRRGFKGSVVHEAFPGHHLQTQIAGMNPNPVRNYDEGWSYSKEGNMTFTDIACPTFVHLCTFHIFFGHFLFSNYYNFFDGHVKTKNKKQQLLNRRKQIKIGETTCIIAAPTALCALTCKKRTLVR